MKTPYVTEDQVGFFAPQSKQLLFVGIERNLLKIASMSDFAGAPAITPEFASFPVLPRINVAKLFDFRPIIAGNSYTKTLHYGACGYWVQR